MESKMVDLSQLYSNPFLQIRSFKQQIDPQISAHSPEPLTLEDKLETNANISPKRQNVYGKTEVCRICQKQKALSEIEIQAVCKRYQSGNSVYKLAEDFKCHRSTISAVLKRNGVEVSHKASTKPELVKRVIELYAENEDPKRSRRYCRTRLRNGTASIKRERNLYPQKLGVSQEQIINLNIEISYNINISPSNHSKRTNDSGNGLSYSLCYF